MAGGPGLEQADLELGGDLVDVGAHRGVGVEELVAAGGEPLDLRSTQIPAPLEILEDAGADVLGLGQHGSALVLGLLDDAFLLLPRLAAQIGGCGGERLGVFARFGDDPLGFLGGVLPDHGGVGLGCGHGRIAGAGRLCRH